MTVMWDLIPAEHKSVQERRGDSGRTGSGLSWALLYSLQIFQALPSAVTGLSVLGSTGESHADPGYYLYVEHAGRF